MPLSPTINGAYVSVVTMTLTAITAHYQLATITTGAVTTLYPNSGNPSFLGIAVYTYSSDTTPVTTVAGAVTTVQQALVALICQQEGLSVAAGDTVVFAS